MHTTKEILILDESGFSKVCSAILNNEGYQTRLVVSSEDAEKQMSGNGISLVVSSFPYAVSFLESNKNNDVPAIILSDELSSDLMEIMKGIKNAVCLVKPLDYERFKYIVHGIINGHLSFSGGNIIA